MRSTGFLGHPCSGRQEQVVMVLEQEIRTESRPSVTDRRSPAGSLAGPRPGARAVSDPHRACRGASGPRPAVELQRSVDPAGRRGASTTATTSTPSPAGGSTTTSQRWRWRSSTAWSSTARPSGSLPSAQRALATRLELFIWLNLAHRCPLSGFHRLTKALFSGYLFYVKLAKTI